MLLQRPVTRLLRALQLQRMGKNWISTRIVDFRLEGRRPGDI